MSQCNSLASFDPHSKSLLLAGRAAEFREREASQLEPTKTRLRLNRAS